MSPSPREAGLDLGALIRDIGGGARGARDLDAERAFTLFKAMLAGEVPALELGAILMALRNKGESSAERVAFVRALETCVGRLEVAADDPHPVILAAYGGARHRPDLTLLLALLLRRYGVPVLIHGPGDGGAGAAHGSFDEASGVFRDVATITRDATLDILRELGIEPAHDLADAQRLLAQHRVAYAPLAIIAPGLATLLDHCARLGGPSFVPALVTLIDPFRGDGYRVFGVTPRSEHARMRDLLIATRARALLLHPMHDASATDPHGPAPLEAFTDGVGSVCGETGISCPEGGSALPAAGDAVTAADWIAQALAGSIPVPAPIIVQLACCLQGTRRSAP